MKISYEKHTKELSEKLEKTQLETEGMTEIQKALDLERIRVDDLQVALGEVESERDTLTDKLRDHDILVSTSSSLEEQNSSLVKDVTDLKQKLAFIQEEFDVERTELNDVVHKSKVLLQEKIEEFKAQKLQYDTLLSDNAEMNTYKRNVMILEQEKRELETQIVTMTVESRKANNNTASRTTAPEGSDAELSGQIDFLNSVIVDMQKKNDDLKTKLELFETAGIIDSDAEMAFMFNGVSSRSVAPRLFCDICDEFDLHDTEDCPTQAMPDIAEESESHTKSRGQRGATREYCDVCEAFGHDTENCNEGETF